MGTTQFQSLNLGFTKATSVSMETIKVCVFAGNMLPDYAREFVEQCYFKAPLSAEKLALSETEVLDYINFLIQARVEFVRDHIHEYWKYKTLHVPAYVQHVLEQIGRVVRYDVGLEIIPTFDETISLINIDQALKISGRIAHFKDDIVMVQNAFPRTKDGNTEVMSTAVLAGFVASTIPVSPAASYLGAFLNFRLEEEKKFALLYRHQYDDVNFIRASLIPSGGLF